MLHYLDEEETATEEKDSLKLIKSKDIAAAEKSFTTYTLDKSKTSTFTRGGAGRDVSSTRGKGKGKGKGRQKGKSALNQVSGGLVGKSSKPRTGGCHRCGGPYFCPLLHCGSPEAGQLVAHLLLPLTDQVLLPLTDQVLCLSFLYGPLDGALDPTSSSLSFLYSP